MTKITIETEWGEGKDKVVVENDCVDLDVFEMMQLMKQALNGYGYADTNVYDAFKFMIEEYKYLDEDSE